MSQDLVLLQHMILQPWNLRNLAVFPEQMLPVILVQAVSTIYKLLCPDQVLKYALYVHEMFPYMEVILIAAVG